MRDINSLLEELDTLTSNMHPDSIYAAAINRAHLESDFHREDKKLPILLSAIMSVHLEDGSTVSKAEHKAKADTKYVEAVDRLCKAKTELLRAKAVHESKLNRYECVKSIISVEQSLMKLV